MSAQTPDEEDDADDPDEAGREDAPDDSLGDGDEKPTPGPDEAVSDEDQPAV